MATEFKKPVHSGRSYTVRFKNHNASTGVVVVLVAWVPNHGAAVPGMEHMVLAPGVEESIQGQVPASQDARRMTVVVDLDAGEFGQLELLEDGETHSAGAVTETTVWKMVVI